MSVLDMYEPKRVLEFFEEISAIPRDSLKEEKIADYLVAFAHKRGLEVQRDAFHNVMIKKPATIGYEDCDTLILQGHSDMVCIKEAGVNHDFEKDGLDLYVENGLIRARGTTLGADNGIALGYGLAVLDSSEIQHPALEVVFTAAEEIGMVGARNFDTGWLTGRSMISFDSGGFTEGRIYVGCAGGQRFTLKKKIRRENCESLEFYRISVGGLKGGHAGGDIAKGRGNASVIMGRLLQKLRGAAENLYLMELQCGDANNPIKHAIPDQAYAIIGCVAGKIPDALVEKFCAEIEAELANEDDGIFVRVQRAEKEFQKALCGGSFQALVDALLLLPNGVLSMHKYFTDTPETSCNVGAVELEEDELTIYVSARSDKESGLDFVKAKVEAVARLRDFGEVEATERIPGWKYNPCSPLKDLVEMEYQKCYGASPRFKITHASTECGMFKKGIEDLDVISIGPIIYEEHTVNEYMEIYSVNELWKFLCAILKETKRLQRRMV